MRPLPSLLEEHLVANVDDLEETSVKGMSCSYIRN